MPLPSFGFKRRSDDPVFQSPLKHDVHPYQDRASVAVRGSLESLTTPLQTTSSRRSSFSSIPSVRSQERQTRSSAEADAGPLGLTVVYTPDNELPKADIVFVHGLGGTSRFTWSRDKNPALFWPMHFLPQESDIGQARILTFGYNANFRRKGGVGVSITDFAKDLLFDLRYAKDELGDDLDIGRVPLIFVVHSMGGLIIKEAYIQGQNDPEYESIVQAISAITFLATPHRGTNLASMLNSILQSTFFNNSKQYISDLNQNSIALQRLNDQFRHIAPKLDIISFYETRPTSLGLKNASVMILGQDSSVLGYPGETSKALDADHHNVCKYQGIDDPNYIVVRNALKSLMAKVLTSKGNLNKRSSNKRHHVHDLKALLGIADMPDSDYIFFQDQWVQGTSDWILEHPKYMRWTQTTPKEKSPRILWLHGGPATGKSVLSSFIINQLVRQGRCCQYFYVRFGDRKKRGLGAILRLIAYQLAQSVPAFAEKIFAVADEGVNLESIDITTFWESVFKSGLAALVGTLQPLYWIIDGVDEAKDPRALIKQFSDSSLSTIPMRLLLISRKTPSILTAFNKISGAFEKDSLDVEGHQDGLRHFVRQELRLTADPEYQQEIEDRIVNGSGNNFLWVRLAVDQVNSCHTQSDVDIALEQLPPGMEALYGRMESTICERPNPSDRALATTILKSVLCSQRTLTIAELAQALDKDVSKILDLQNSIVDLCAGFVVIDNSGHVAMVHQTAREYLLDTQNERVLLIDSDDAHSRMFLSCISCLMTVGLRGKIAGQQIPELLDYAAIYWSKHLTRIAEAGKDILDAANKFLGGPWMLTWIHYMSTRQHLETLVQVARHLGTYFARQRRLQPMQNAEDSARFLKQSLLEGWSTDLVKIVGKFGPVLRQYPDSIYKMIPPFCPPNSTLHQIHGRAEARNLAVSGLHSEDWDDSLARISFGPNTFATSLAVAGNRLAISATSGPTMKIIMYETSTFEELQYGPIRHGERVLRMMLNSIGSILVTYGYRTTKIWDLLNGQCVLSVDNFEIGQRPLAMQLMLEDQQLVIGTDDRILRSLDLTDEFPSWQVMAELEEPELDGLNLNAASCMALNRDGTLIAVAYRGHPLSAWEVEGPVHLGHCWRTQDGLTYGQVIEVAWNPQYPEIFGIYMGGNLFRWRPYDDEKQELPAGASKLSVSRDGNLVATGDARGTIKVYATHDLSLLYQLTSEDPVLGLLFSPDVFRIYDVRGDHANVWEPNSLIKFIERNNRKVDRGNDTESLTSSTMSSAVSRSKRVDSVITLAASALGRFYAYGNERGTVILYDVLRAKSTSIYFAKNFLSIEKIAWSPDAKYLSFVLTGRRVIVMSINVGRHETEDLDAIILLDTTLKSTATKVPISQLLFSQSSEELAVITSMDVKIISLKSLEIVRKIDFQKSIHAKWITHPADSALMLGFTVSSVTLLSWDLMKQHESEFEHPTSLEFSDRHSGRSNTFAACDDNTLEKAVVDRVLARQGRNPLMLVQISLDGPYSRRKTFLEFDISWFSSPLIFPGLSETTECFNTNPGTDCVESPETRTTLSPRHFFSQELVNDVDFVLDFASHDRLVYLSRNFTVCTWQRPRKVASTNISKQPETFTTPSEEHHNSKPLFLSGPSGQVRPTQFLSHQRGAQPLGSSNSITNAPNRSSFLAAAGRSRAARPSNTVLSSKKSDTATKILFHLPRDWINHDCLSLSTLWLKEKSVLFSKNGEVAVVRCAALG